MYFDFDYYWRVLRHLWSLKRWSERSRMQRRYSGVNTYVVKREILL